MSKLAIAVLCAALAACGPSQNGGGTGDGDGNGGGPDAAGGGNWPDAGGNPTDEFADAAPTQACGKMDILFVVDNSGSMLEEQENLADNFPRFIEVLDNFDNELDYRVGVTTTGRDYTWQIDSPLGPLPNSQTGGDNGALLQSCGMTRRWVEKADADRSNTFSCAAEVGDQGPAMEMPLAVIKQAFSDRVSDGTNAGFLRDDALLAIVILTDEDDCSYEQSVTLGLTEIACTAKVEPVTTYKSFLDNLTGGAGRWAVAAIAGPGPGQCESEFGSAAEATRLKNLAQMAGQNGIVSSICDGDLSGALEQALETFDTACQDFPPVD
jgi:hypothetical protein